MQHPRLSNKDAITSLMAQCRQINQRALEQAQKKYDVDFQSEGPPVRGPPMIHQIRKAPRPIRRPRIIVPRRRSFVWDTAMAALN